MKWVDNRENYCGRHSQVKLDKWELDRLLSNFQHGKVDSNGKKIPLTSAEELAYQALRNLEMDYRRKENYYDRRERQVRYQEESRQLAEQLSEVTEERDSLLEKIKEAQITAGLFIKSVKEKLGWEK